MSQRANDHGQLRRRAAGGASWRFLWMLAALGSVSVLGISTAAGLTYLRMPRVATLTGHLKDTAQIQIVDLPKGVGIDRVMVRDGDPATEGQALVSLNPASIVAAAQQVAAKIAFDQQLLACLQASAASALPTFAGVAAGPVALPDQTQMLSFAEAALECAQQTAPVRRALDALDKNDAMLAARSTLIDRRIKLELAHLSAAAVGRDNRAKLALGLAWEQTRIENERAANLQRRHEITTLAAANLAERIPVLRENIRRNEIELAYLSRLHADPRLVSPSDCIILETKEIAPGQVFGVPMPLVRLVPTNPQRFEVRLALSSSPPAHLRENGMVQIELIGTAMRWPPLAGHVAGIEVDPTRTDTGGLQALIALEPESTAALAEMSAQSGFVGDGSALAVQAVVPEQPLAAVMITAWAAAMPPRPAP